MKISHKLLLEISACSSARAAFVKEFGAEAEVEPVAVFRALAKAGHKDWLWWLASNLNGFSRSVGNVTEGNHHSITEGKLELSSGFVQASGSASVLASGSASVQASGSASVEAYDSASVEASGSASVRAYGSASVEASGSASVLASGSASVEAYGSASVRAYGSASVRAYDSATLLLTSWSTNVNFSIESEMACAVDRRNGTPQLITYAPRQELAP